MQANRPAHGRQVLFPTFDGKDESFVDCTAQFAQLSVQMKHLPAARPFVKVVDILGNHPNIEHILQPGQCIMSRIGFRSQQLPSSHIIKSDNLFPVSCQSFRSTDILYPVISPQTVRIAERSDTAVGTDAGSGEDNQFFFSIPLTSDLIRIYTVPFSSCRRLTVRHTGNTTQATTISLTITSATHSARLRPPARKRCMLG